ncbi:hypothetical protein [Bifidobacterium canis]|uniref:Uncharacterized protein n=1 Tax=Bifidobacterium canis TaxID=2610880 RepID=A0A7K1J3T5_9BIFI|nr:hypothetical protein [Bifidobacterium canis]MUH59210.1 hypothetical protein [Bifidobacterium canis]
MASDSNPNESTEKREESDQNRQPSTTGYVVFGVIHLIVMLVIGAYIFVGGNFQAALTSIRVWLLAIVVTAIDVAFYIRNTRAH